MKQSLFRVYVGLISAACGASFLMIFYSLRLEWIGAFVFFLPLSMAAVVVHALLRTVTGNPFRYEGILPDEVRSLVAELEALGFALVGTVGVKATATTLTVLLEQREWMVTAVVVKAIGRVPSKTAPIIGFSSELSPWNKDTEDHFQLDTLTGTRQGLFPLPPGHVVQNFPKTPISTLLALHREGVRHLQGLGLKLTMWPDRSPEESVAVGYRKIGKAISRSLLGTQWRTLRFIFGQIPDPSDIRTQPGVNHVVNEYLARHREIGTKIENRK